MCFIKVVITSVCGSILCLLLRAFSNGDKPSSWHMFVYKYFTSIVTSIAFSGIILISSILLRKSVVSSIYDCTLCARGCI